MEMGPSNQDLHDAIAVAAKAAQTDPVFLSVDAKAERVLLAQQLRTLTDAICVGAAEAATLGGVAATAKLRTVAQFVAAEAGVDPAPVRGDVAIGGWLRSFPVFEDAFCRGEITRRHLDKLRDLHSPKVHALMINDQQILLDAAVSCSFRDFTQAAQYWLLCADPDGSLPKEQLRNSGVSIRKRADGCIEGTFVLDPLRGQAFTTAFDRELQALLASDSEAGIERSNSQRGADALVNLVSAGHKLARRHKTTPLVNVVVGAKTAEQILNRLEAAISDDEHDVGLEDWDLDADDVDRRCELVDGTPVHPWFALAAMSVGRFQRHIFKPGGREIARSTNQRSFTPAQKHILMVQARGRCSTPGCDAPFAWLHADHRHPFGKGGETSMENGDSKCGPDNQWKTDRTDL